MTLTMYDDVTLSLIPPDAAAVAGYVDGRFANFKEAVSRFPHAHHLSIAVSASSDADCLDVETGDATPGEAPAWVRRQHARGITRPVVYANMSTMPSVLAALGAAGIPRSSYRVWTAHYTGTPHIEPGSDATQYTDRALGRSLDASLCSDAFFSTPAPKPAPAPSEPGLSPAQRVMFWRIWHHNPGLAHDDTHLSAEQRHLFDAIWDDGFHTAGGK